MKHHLNPDFILLAGPAMIGASARCVTCAAKWSQGGSFLGTPAACGTSIAPTAFRRRFHRISKPSFSRRSSNVAYRMNKDVVSSGREFVWGLDDSQADFVRTRIAANPDRVILTGEQRKAAIDAAGKYTPDENEAA